MQWALPEELQAKELPLIDKVMPMPKGPAESSVVMNDPTFNGPMFGLIPGNEMRLN